MQLTGRSDAVPGGTLPVTVNPDKMHLFDASSGVRLTEQ
jgi:multiple sugar transport system ATP-binding protein